MNDIIQTDGARPIKIKDHSGKGKWDFESKEYAVKILRGEESRQYMLAYGDINAIANLDPMRWSSYMGIFQMLSELHHIDHTDPEKSSRPCHIKDKESGDWRFESFQFAMDG